MPDVFNLSSSNSRLTATTRQKLNERVEYVIGDKELALEVIDRIVGEALDRSGEKLEAYAAGAVPIRQIVHTLAEETDLALEDAWKIIEHHRNYFHKLYFTPAASTTDELTDSATEVATPFGESSGKKAEPPKVASLLLRWVSKKNASYEIDDLLELYEEKARIDGEKEARAWLNSQVWRSIKPHVQEGTITLAKWVFAQIVQYFIGKIG